MTSRLDEVCQDTKSGPFRAGRYRTDHHLRDSALWRSHRFSIEPDIRTSILEPIPLTAVRPAVHDGGIASRDLLCRLRTTRQPDGAVYRAELGARRHGHDDHLPSVHQHPSWRVHCHDRRHRHVSVELCQSGHNFHLVCALGFRGG